ncbi:putative ABC-class ATPase [Sinobaca qinghaiensis]|uniref:Putative ABC-class ATPase n=1 Tax=Sinobaca qinghaiensis TaxID=342944 RepID=A0A419V5R4_9BACL|nr:ABC-ATPase domain-containing protein [Sinobaca qinghaiensis]RKD75310.1 putative ABC-class ATPase [Sinobaca qinghaiensis]
MQQLKKQLQRIDKKGYKAYNDIKGSYRFEGFTLKVDHVQADPYASPSKVRVVISLQDLGIGKDEQTTPSRKTAVIDYFAERMMKELRSGKDQGGILIDGPGQEVMDRTAVKISAGELEVRLSVHLPAKGRTIMGKQAEERLTGRLPAAVKKAVHQFEQKSLKDALELADQQDEIRRYLTENKAAGFIANGAVLPRESGISSRPMKSAEARTFQSPPSMEVTIPLPHRSPISGMLIKEGVTLITGGGYHGKSTLLEAIESGVYNHRRGDGREYVITLADAAKIRAEDGRSVTRTDISMFISNLPNKKNTAQFTTENASGSTSQAANIMESLEAGSRCLLIDEDTSATNFMIRDSRMQELVHSSKEPITPFVSRVRPLYKEHGVSTILVVGGTGDYFSKADTVLMMDEYIPYDVTEEAHRIAEKDVRAEPAESAAPLPAGRKIQWNSFDASRGRKTKAGAKGRSTIMYGKETIDLSSVEQIVNTSQTEAVARIIQALEKHFASRAVSFEEAFRYIDKIYKEKGLDGFSIHEGVHPGEMALPRTVEIAAAASRYRRLRTE